MLGGGDRRHGTVYRVCDTDFKGPGSRLGSGGWRTTRLMRRHRTKARWIEPKIEAILTMAEAGARLRAGRSTSSDRILEGRHAVKKQPDLVEVFGDRIGRIDREAFERWALLKLPSAAGTALSDRRHRRRSGFDRVGLPAGRGRPGPRPPRRHGRGLGRHPRAWPTGSWPRAMGMKVSHWFVGSVRKPQPGVKVDYATYLRTPARQRAWMHASGAIVSKLVPFIASERDGR